MNKHYFYLITGIIFLACGNRIRERDHLDNIPKDSLKFDTSIRQCIPEKDTLFGKDNYISYVIIDSFYTVKVQIDGRDTLLPYKFNCSTPGGLVPSIHSFYDNTVCLIRGAGQHYREFLICYVDSGRINLNDYETALAVDLKRDIVAYQSIDTFQIVYVENIKTKSRKKNIIPSNFSSLNISKVRIEKEKLIIKFMDDKEMTFLL